MKEDGLRNIKTLGYRVQIIIKKGDIDDFKKAWEYGKNVIIALIYK